MRPLAAMEPLDFKAFQSVSKQKTNWKSLTFLLRQSPTKPSAFGFRPSAFAQGRHA
jgi:hypothetical protein